MISAFVTGWPVDHSLSPLIHNHWLDRYGIEGSYERLAKRPEEIEAFLASLGNSQWAGGNVTIPHKETAFRACAVLDDAARTIGAVNTVWIEDGRLAGANTDAYGFTANLDDCAQGWDQASIALVLGAGGAARAIVHALLTRGFTEIVVINRTLERAETLATHFGESVRPLIWQRLSEEIPRAGLIVNTTSLGMKGQPSMEIDLAACHSDAVIADIVYTPLETPLLAQAREQGLKTVDGLGMLLHQAVPGFERWFGHRPEVDEELRNVLLNALEQRSRET